jgi:hypothetical protein
LVGFDRFSPGWTMDAKLRIAQAIAAACVWLSVAGCDRQPAAMTDEAQADPSPRGSQTAGSQRGLRPGNTSSTENFGVIVHRSYGDLGPAGSPSRPLKKIAVEVELRLPPEETAALDPQQIQLMDDQTTQLYACESRTQRLTDDAQAADNNDPVFAGKWTYRCLLFYEVQPHCRFFRLMLNGQLLTARPLVLGSGAPVVPLAAVEPIAVLARPKLVKQSDSYVVVLKCRNWTRVQTPQGSTLRCLTRDKTVAAELAAYVEVDEKMMPFEVLTAARPYYIWERFFVCDFWCPQDATVVDINVGGSTLKLPSSGQPAIPNKTLEALGQAAKQQEPRPPRP